MNGQVRIIFTTPELLLTDAEWSDVFQSPSVVHCLVAVVVDEAHCVKKWWVIHSLYLSYCEIT